MNVMDAIDASESSYDTNWPHVGLSDFGDDAMKLENPFA